MSDRLARAREVATVFLDDLCDGLQEKRDVDRLTQIIATAIDEALDAAVHLLECGHPANCQRGDDYGHFRCGVCEDLARARLEEAKLWQSKCLKDFPPQPPKWGPERIAELEASLRERGK